MKRGESLAATSVVVLSEDDLGVGLFVFQRRRSPTPSRHQGWDKASLGASDTLVRAGGSACGGVFFA
ncbi:hypothetical protein CA13_31090 [Planctomycetes bacterium CA13]|uniref:Uncharacterized protein n=1 Tax=Novipirellula herctigrandis TaxID=2527986 RepID=A0A5C5Z3T7_9BACT|nr:hypothetical protein CA13_31090 [Planctomycetes bacterium CA13]